MTIYVDELVQYKKSKVSHISNYWCHMASDSSLVELHKFAAAIGLKRSWFQDHASIPHYDLIAAKRKLALTFGAIELNNKEFIRNLRAQP